MLLRREQGILFLNCYKYKRRFDSGAVRLFVRWKSSGLRILFFGTDNFSLPSLQRLNEERLNGTCVKSLEVVTSYKKPKNPVLKFAEHSHLPVQRWPIESTEEKICDLGIVVSFGHLIPEKVISSCSLGMINVHASLLPKWRGAAPIIYALKHGDKKTGVTIMKIEPKHFDIGDILTQKEVEISENILLPDLHENMANEGADLLISAVKRYPDILCDAKPQDLNQATYAPKITQDICNVDWSRMTALQIFNLYRALYSFKHLVTKWQTQTIKLVEVRRTNFVSENIKPGFVEFNWKGKCLRVYCADGTCIEVLKVCLEGRKSITAVDFHNGFLKNSSIERRYFLYEKENKELKVSKQIQ